MFNQEEWKTVEQFPRYQVSNYGRVKSCIGVEKILIPSYVRGYQVVKLSKVPSEKGKYQQYCRRVHRLVAKAFCQGYADDKQVHHIDRQRDNNHYGNLLCVTKTEHEAIHKKLKIEDQKKSAAEKGS